MAIRTARDWSDRSVGTYASSMAFFFFMSLIPLLILLMQLLPLVHLTEVELLLFIEQMIPESAYDLARRIVSEAYRASGSVALLSALVLLWSASRGTIALRWGLNRLYDAEENRPLPLLYIISIGYTIIMLVIFVLMLVVIFAGPVSAFLTMPPTEDIAEAIAYTNALLSAKQPAAETKPAEAEKKDEKKPEAKDAAKDGKKDAAKDAKKDDKKGEAKADKKADKDAKKDSKDEAKPAEEEKPAEEAKPAEEEKKPEVELPMAVKQMADMWKDVYFFRASNMRVQAHVIKLLQLAETVNGMTAEDKETVEKIG